MPRPASKDATPRQQEILDWIKTFIHDHDMPPTVREISGYTDDDLTHQWEGAEREGVIERTYDLRMFLAADLIGRTERVRCSWRSCPAKEPSSAGRTARAWQNSVAS